MSAHDMSGISRRSFIRASGSGLGAASLALLTAPGTVPRAKAASTAPAGLDLIDAVLEAFQTHRLVGLGEAHGLQNHHDALGLLLSDPRVPAVVDDIVIEFANALYQPTIDRFIAGEPIDNEHLRPVWRNTTQSPDQTWDQPVYEQFLRTVRAANWTLAPGQQIRVLAGDPPIDWSKITTPSQWSSFLGQRDTHAASVIEKHVLAKGHRALLCYGGEHLTHATPGNIASIVEQKTGESTYTIADLTFVTGDPGGLATSLSAYARDTVIPTAGTWLGALDSADLLGKVAKPAKPPGKKRPKATDATNSACGPPLRTLIDAGLYMGQPNALTASWWNPAIYLDPTYWKELQRRNAITGALTLAELASYRHEQPAQYPLTRVRRSQLAGCGRA